MMQSIYTPELDLHLFEGEGGDGGTGAAAEAAQQAPVYTSARAKKGENLSNVVYGKQVTTNAADPQSGDAGRAEHNGVQTTSDTLEARRKAYRDAISGEYKDLYTEDVHRIINQRFRETKTLEQRVSDYQPIIDMLQSRYKIKDGDAKALQEALDDDVDFWADEAAEMGMSDEAYKQYRRMERTTKAALEADRQRQGRERAEAQLQQWYGEAQQVKAKYPDFDLNAEVQNPQFRALLQSHVPMEHAYKVLHMDEIVNQERMTTAAATEERVVANVRARGARPKEAGNATSSAFVTKPDVNKLTKADRAEIARRAARGEKISF